MLIIGAGLAGLIAAHAWPQMPLVESAPAPLAAHHALLRFRSDAVSRLTGIEFRQVRVHKGIWAVDRFVSPSIQMSNLYSMKCLGTLMNDRSIWSIDSVDRFIAPENFYAQMIEAASRRIEWGVAFKFDQPAISTAPLPFVLDACQLNAHALAGNEVVFKRSPITVQRFRVSNADVFQTVYFPDPAHSVYRASITGSLLIVEHAGTAPRGEWRKAVEEAFALPVVQELSSVKQIFGKITPIDDATRKKILFTLTHEHGIYSLGRFATWRNILLDDVVDDIAVIKRLQRSATHYDIRKVMA